MFAGGWGLWWGEGGLERRWARFVDRVVLGGEAEGGVGRVVRWVVYFSRVLVFGVAIVGGRDWGCLWERGM